MMEGGSRQKKMSRVTGKESESEREKKGLEEVGKK